MVYIIIPSNSAFYKNTFDVNQSYQQQNRHEYVHPATAHNVLEQFLALTTPESSGTHCYPMNEQTLMKGHHEVSRQFLMSTCSDKKIFGNSKHLHSNT